MATDTMIVRVRPGEVRIALKSAKDRLKDFAVYRTQAGPDVAQAGDVFLGRVKKVAPALEAVFVDIGQERDGFLGLSDARPHQHASSSAVRERISDYLHEGEAVTVQVLAEARDDKGAKLTRRITVAGALSVLTPGDPGVRVSKRIGDAVERNRLRAAVTGTLGKGEGCVLRSAALGASEGALRGDIALLRARWAELEGRAAAAAPPARLSGADMAPLQFLDDTGVLGLNRIVVDDAAMAKALRAELDKLGVDLPGGVERHTGHTDVFEALGVADEAAGLLDPFVPLKSGGSLIIEETAALTAIDVNAGAGGGAEVALRTNLEAVEEAARQMRLRNLGGLIVVDLMAMRGEGTVGRVLGALREAVARDPAGPHVLGVTKAGLLEITRPRRRPPLSQVLLGPCPAYARARAESALTTGLKALDAVLAEVWAAPSLVPALRARAEVLRALEDQAPDALAEVEEKLGQPLELVADETVAPGSFRVEPAKE